MLRLVELGFILHKREGLREYAHVLLLNPLAVCAQLNAEGRGPEKWWTAFVRRANEIGATIPAPIELRGAGAVAAGE
jgi:hypothetical protein